MQALAEMESDGMAKMVYRNDTGEILGVHIFGLHAADLIHEASNAVATNQTVQVCLGHACDSDELCSSLCAIPSSTVHGCTLPAHHNRRVVPRQCGDLPVCRKAKGQVSLACQQQHIVQSGHLQCMRLRVPTNGRLQPKLAVTPPIPHSCCAAICAVSDSNRESQL